MNILRKIFGVAVWAVDRVEAVIELNTGKSKAEKALEIVFDAIGGADIQDAAAASAVSRGIQQINDGIITIQNAVGDFTHARKPAPAKKKTAAKKK